MLRLMETPNPDAGYITLRDNTYHLDASASALLHGGDAKETEIQLSVSDMLSSGPEVITTRGPKLLGDWLHSDLLLKSSDIGWARATAEDSTVIDVFTTTNALHLAINRQEQRSRHARHELRNRVNAIKMNGELIKLLAQKDGHDRLVKAADAVITQCDGLVSENESGQSKPGFETLVNSDPSPTHWLRQLHGTPGQHNPAGDIVLTLPEQCPHELCAYLSHILALVSASATDTVNIAVVDGSNNEAVMHCNSAAVKQMATQLLAVQGNNFAQFSASAASSLRISPAISAYEIRPIEPDSQLTFLIADQAAPAQVEE